jgi:hypothetical protein
MARVTSTPESIPKLESRKERLHKESAANLDFLIGSVTTQGPRGGFSLTCAERGKTRGRYIRNTLVEEVRRMTGRHRTLKELLKELSEVNWLLLKAKSDF